MRKEEKAKVGRPKLADSKTKKESLFICLFVLVIAVIVAIIGYKTLMIDFNPRYAVGTVYNKNVNSCIIENNKIKCGSNVTYMKYKTNNDDYIELNKQEKNIEVDIKNANDVQVCYKTNTTEIKCNK